MPGDLSLGRIERTAAGVCVVMALMALALGRGRLSWAAAVLGGGLLAAVSYRAIKGGVHGLMLLTIVPAEAPRQPPTIARRVVGLALRYALLAFLAYVMIARLRLHPVGLLAGASSLVAAVAVEAVRLLIKKP